MPTFTVTFLSRDDQGRYTRRHETINATDRREAESWVRHGTRNGKWFVEGTITVRGPIGHTGCSETTIPV